VSDRAVVDTDALSNRIVARFDAKGTRDWEADALEVKLYLTGESG
jgi:hypothetical protein